MSHAPLKSAGGHGRQDATSLTDISPDHLHRYGWAAQMLATMRFPDGIRANRAQIVIDAGCGIGYGSFMMAEGMIATGGTGIVCGFDLEPAAIQHAKEHFPHVGVEYIVGDATRFFAERPVKPDAAVAFEMLEHLDTPSAFLRGLAGSGAKMLLASVPNEEDYPFVATGGDARVKGTSPRGHRRHYTPAEFEMLLLEGGWRPIGRFSQKSKTDPVVRTGWMGRTILALAVPAPGAVDEP